MKRVEVWWARLPPPVGRRPVVLVSRDDAYEQRRFVMVAPVSTRVRGSPAEVLLGPEEGLRQPSAANLDSLITIPKALLEDFVSTLSPTKLVALDDALRYALGLR